MCNINLVFKIGIYHKLVKSILWKFVAWNRKPGNVEIRICIWNYSLFQSYLFLDILVWTSRNIIILSLTVNICTSGISTNGSCLYVSLIVRVIFPEKEKIQIKVKRLSHKKTCFVWVYLLILLWGVNNVCFCRSKYHFMTIGADTSLGITVVDNLHFSI